MEKAKTLLEIVFVKGGLTQRTSEFIKARVEKSRETWKINQLDMLTKP
jgi:hypothetical protein